MWARIRPRAGVREVGSLPSDGKASMTETEANEMGIVELFRRVVLMNEKIEDVPRRESV